MRSIIALNLLSDQWTYCLIISHVTDAHCLRRCQLIDVALCNSLKQQLTWLSSKTASARLIMWAAYNRTLPTGTSPCSELVSYAPVTTHWNWSQLVALDDLEQDEMMKHGAVLIIPHFWRLCPDEQIPKLIRLEYHLMLVSQRRLGSTCRVDQSYDIRPFLFFFRGALEMYILGKSR